MSLITFSAQHVYNPTPHMTLRHSMRRRDNRLRHRLYVTDYTHQQVIGLGHQIQAFIQMPLIFMTGDVIWAARWPRTVRPPSSWRMDTVKFYGLFPNHAPPHGGFTLSCNFMNIHIILVNQSLLSHHEWIPGLGWILYFLWFHT